MRSKRLRIAWLASVVIAAGTLTAAAAETPGVSANEIKIGQTMPYSGPASAYGVIGRAQLAYFKMINEEGGVNGHKINLISLDDGYAPPNKSRARMRRCTSLGPSPMRRMRISRYQRSNGKSLVTP